MSVSAKSGNRLAIDGGQPVRCVPFPAWPVFGDAEERGIVEVLRSGRWGAMEGDVTSAFEGEFAAFQQARFCQSVANASLGLYAAMLALGVGPGDEVIVPAYTFVASATSVLFAGGIPVLVDIDPDTLQIDVDSAANAITSRTKVIMPVHLVGRAADLDRVTDLAAQRGLAVLEDAAQAHGTEWRERGVGAIGTAGVFSFQSSKNMTAGEGGAILTDDADLADRIHSLVNLGRVRGHAPTEHRRIGHNLRISEFQSAILRAQLRRYPQHLARARANVDRLDADLAGVEHVRPVVAEPCVTGGNGYAYGFSVAGQRLHGGKARFIEVLRAEGIPCRDGYVGIDSNEAVTAGIRKVAPEYVPPQLPGVRRAERDAVWLPHEVLLGDADDMRDVVAAISKVSGALIDQDS